MPRRSRRLALVLMVGVLVAGFAVGSTYSAFSRTTSTGSNTITGKRIFPLASPSLGRPESAWSLGDASGGAAPVVKDDPLSFVDAVVTTTGLFGSAYSATRYVDIDFQGSRPANVPITSANFNLTYAAGAAGDVACFYVELRRTSTGALLSTYGSASTTSPPAAGCMTGIAQTTKTVAITIPSADQNDLTVRVYGYESGAKAFKIDRATITGTTYGDSWTMYEQRFGDRAAGGASPTYTSWSLQSQDAVLYTSAAVWGTTAAAAKYLKLGFGADPIPSSAVVTSATFKFRFASVGGAGSGNACAYYEVYSSGNALLGTHGSSGSPSACSTGATAVTDTVTLPELNTAAKANGFYVKAYMWETGGKKATVDLVEADINYYLD
ncbi:MAG: hypothetical protein QOC95_1474 [Thermoleophilaceae bacterium]|jgi:hypothetical protein|nr:hypothetical protein [Thermoleophilaceae bacterium]